MVNIHDEYKKEIDAFSEKTNNITASDILKLAEVRTSEDKPVLEFKTRSKKKTLRKTIVLIAACVTLLGATCLAAGTAGYGPLAKLFKETLNDDVSADLVEKGYLYEVNQSATDGDFRIDLIAVTGDAATPKLLFDIYVNDESLASTYDTLRILCYTLGVYQYENEFENFGPDEAWAVKDSEVHNLYHASILGAPVWMCSGDPVVAAITQINFPVDNDYWSTYDVKMEYRFTPPSDIYFPTTSDYFFDENGVPNENAKFSHGGIDYYLRSGEFGAYNSILTFEYDYEGTSLAGSETNYSVLEEKLQSNWLELVDDMKLIVDGIEYDVNPEIKGYTWCDENGEFGIVNHCNINPYFPSIDYNEVNSIMLKAGNQEIVIK